MESKATNKHRITALVWCFLAAALILLFCTKSSFLYPFNDWEDDNIIFTVGRGLFQGKVPFRDLYDLKGPFAYLLFGIAGLISTRSFIGLYVVEVICFTGFLFYSWKTISLFEKKNAIWTMPVIAMLIASSMAFTHGGSVEELSLPALAYGLYSILAYYKNGYSERMPFRTLFINGILAGCMFWTKYTMLGMYLGWMATLFFVLIGRAPRKDAWIAAGEFLLGMAAASVPWIIYFGVNGAMSELIRYYFVYNITGYGNVERSVLEMILTIGRNTLATFYRNMQYSLLTVLGVGWLTLEKKKELSSPAKVSLWVMCILSCIGIYIGETGYRYYGLVLAVFVPLGMIPILRAINERVLSRIGKNKAVKCIPAVVLVLSAGLSILISDNTYMLSWTKEDLPQYQFAEIMEREKKEDSVKVLCYQMMDSGIYLTAGYEPEFRCFTKLNNSHPEVMEQQKELLDSGRMEFVATKGFELESSQYKKLAESSYWYEEGISVFYLYQKK